VERRKLKFRWLTGSYAIVRLAPDALVPEWATKGEFNSVSRTSEELSIVCPTDNLPPEVHSSHRWICLKLEGPFPFAQTGVLLSFIEPLSTKDVPIFATSTYDTDYVLIQEEFRWAIDALREAGHELLTGDDASVRRTQQSLVVTSPQDEKAQPFSTRDLRQVGAALALAARTEIMPRFGKLRTSQVRQKSSALDLVTDADEAAERAISEALAAAFPGALIVGEEGAYRDPTVLQQLSTAELAFIIDPIDGTKNFVSNLPLFGVMAAATMRGEIVAGVIYDPVSRDWAYALRDGGAWMEYEDGSRTMLRVAKPVPVSAMEGIVGTGFLPEPLRKTVLANLGKLAATANLRCAAHEYRLAAAGSCHLLLYNRLMPWDHAAGWLLHREAGGYSAHFDGTAYQVSHLTGGLICTPDEATWRLARAALLEP